MLSGELLEKVNELLNTIEDNSSGVNINTLFGRKSIVLVGDLLQLAAVSTYEQPITQLNKSQLFRTYFKPFFLNENYRQTTDLIYNEFFQ